MSFQKIKNQVATFLYNLFFLCIVLLKYGSIMGFVGYMIYVAKPQYTTVTYNTKDGEKNEKTEKNLTLYNIFTISTFGKKIPLVKSYIVDFYGDHITVKPIYREPKFFFKDKIYDIEGNLILDHIPTDSPFLKHMIHVYGNNGDFFEIFQMFKSLHTFDMEYNGMGWNIYVYKKGGKFTIKLPIDITVYTRKKIGYLLSNTGDFFNEDYSLIDLRFSNDKIYMVKE